MSYPILFSLEDSYKLGKVSAIAGVAIVGKSVVGEVVESWDTQGLGMLTDAVKCRVYEEINGQYEVTLEYPKNGRHYDEIYKDSVILVDVPREEEKQAFRIYEIEKTLRGTTEFHARHISYDLVGYPVKASSVAMRGIVSDFNSSVTDAIVQPLFTFTTDKTNTTTQFRVTATGSIRSWLGGREGSILDRFGGEWHWNNYNCELLNRRGSDNGYTIRYAKNLTSLRNLLNNEKSYTGVVCVYSDADGNTVSSDVQSTGVGQLVNIFSVDVSAEYETVPTVAQLNTRAQNYIVSAGLNSLDETSVTLSFIDNPDATASVGLGDTVTVQCEDLNFSSRVIKYTWDVLLNRYVELTVGKVVATLSDTIHSIENTTDMTETRHVLKLDSDGYIRVRPLNADADLTPEELINYKRPENFTFFPDKYFRAYTANTEFFIGNRSIIERVYGINNVFVHSGELVNVRADLYANDTYRFKFISKIKNHPEIPSGDVFIAFTNFYLTGTDRGDGDYEDINMTIHGHVGITGNLSVGGLLHAEDVTINDDLTVGGDIVSEQAFTYVSLISPGNSVIRKFPLSWSGIICMYRDSNAMAMYMVRIGSSGTVYVTPIVSDPELTVAPSGVNQFVRLYNNGSIDVKWYYIGKGGY